MPDEIQVLDVDEMGMQEKVTFNHQSLIMSALNKCLELGSVELHEGWWEEKVDKNQNILRTYHTDTRKAFIESVKSLMMVAECDYDETATKNINKLLEIIEKRKQFWINEEWRWWNTLDPAVKDKLTREGKQVVKGFFNPKLNFDNLYFYEETDIYRRICTEISNLTKRLDFYAEISYTA